MLEQWSICMVVSRTYYRTGRWLRWDFWIVWSTRSDAEGFKEYIDKHGLTCRHKWTIDLPRTCKFKSREQAEEALALWQLRQSAEAES